MPRKANPRTLYVDVVSGELVVQNDFPDTPVAQGEVVTRYSVEAAQHIMLEDRKTILELEKRRLACSGKTAANDRSLLDFVVKLFDHGSLINSVAARGRLLNQAVRDLPVNLGLPAELTLANKTLRFEK